MANINLLPWREAQRRERNRVTYIMCAAMCGVAVLVVFMASLFWDGLIAEQDRRNAYLQAEINGLNAIIREIDTLKDKRDALLARMEVIQTLQENRSQIVHVFDDLVTKLPKGVFYDSIKKQGNRLRIAGKAQSNGRVSALMRSLDSSDWFGGATLTVVDVIDQNGALVSKFDITVSEERKSAGGVEALQ